MHASVLPTLLVLCNIWNAYTIKVTKVEGGKGLIVSDTPDVYGNDVILRDYIILTGGDKSWVVRDRPLGAGVLQEFYLYTHNNSYLDGNSAQPIWLQIWRPQSAERTYELVYQREIVVDHSSPSGVFHIVDVATDRFAVQNGDFIGWTIDRSYGAISLTYTEDEKIAFRVLTNEGTIVGNHYEFDRIELPATFSIAAKVAAALAENCPAETQRKEKTSFLPYNDFYTVKFISDIGNENEGRDALLGSGKRFFIKTRSCVKIKINGNITTKSAELIKICAATKKADTVSFGYQLLDGEMMMQDPIVQPDPENFRTRCFAPKMLDEFPGETIENVESAQVCFTSEDDEIKIADVYMSMCVDK